MMKQLILLILVLVSLVLVAQNEQTTIQVIIVVPPELVPYYDWLLNFPGWQQIQNGPANMQPTGLQACNSNSRNDHSAVKIR
jgi:hypothetical protein